MEKALDVDPDALGSPLTTALANTEYAEPLFLQPAKHTILMFHLRKLAQTAQIDGFSTLDIARPQPERTLQNLAALVNYIKFIQHHTDNLIWSLKDRSQGHLLEKKQLLAKIREAEAEMATIRKEIERTQPQYQQLEDDNARLKASLMSKKEMQGQTLQTLEGIKADKQVLQHQKEAIHAQLTNSHEEIARLKSRIVQSPERIKRTITTMGNSAAEDKYTLNELESKIRDLQAKGSALQAIEKDVRLCSEQLQTVQKEVQALDVAYKQLAEVKDNHDDRVIERSELESKQQRTHTQLSNAQERLERAQRHAEEKRVAGQNTLKKLKYEYEKLDVDRKENDKEVESLREQVREIEVQMAESLKQNEKELNDLLVVFWKLRHDADVYMDLLANEILVNELEED